MKKLRLRAIAVWLRGTYYGGKVARNLIKFSQILTIYIQIERINRYTFKKAKLFTFVFNTAFFT